MSGDALAGILLVASRAIWYAGIVGVIGACAFRLVVSPAVASGSPADVPASAGLIAAALLVAGTLARLYAQAYVSFGLDEPLTSELVWIVATDLPPWSAGWLAQFAVSVATVGAFAWRRAARLPPPAVSAIAVAIAASAPLTGHAVAQPGASALPVVLQAAHVLGAGTWIGGLFVLSLVLARRSAAAMPVKAVVDGFSPVALTAASVLAASGGLTALLYVPALDALWTTSYGRALLVKVALSAGVAAMGLVNWRIIRPRLADAGIAARLRRTARIELSLAAAVLLMTALLVGLPQPGE